MLYSYILCTNYLLLRIVLRSGCGLLAARLFDSRTPRLVRVLFSSGEFLFRLSRGHASLLELVSSMASSVQFSGSAGRPHEASAFFINSKPLSRAGGGQRSTRTHLIALLGLTSINNILPNLSTPDPQDRAVELVEHLLDPESVPSLILTRPHPAPARAHRSPEYHHRLQPVRLALAPLAPLSPYSSPEILNHPLSSPATAAMSSEPQPKKGTLIYRSPVSLTSH